MKKSMESPLVSMETKGKKEEDNNRENIRADIEKLRQEINDFQKKISDRHIGLMEEIVEIQKNNNASAQINALKELVEAISKGNYNESINSLISRLEEEKGANQQQQEEINSLLEQTELLKDNEERLQSTIAVLKEKLEKQNKKISRRDFLRGVFTGAVGVGVWSAFGKIEYLLKGFIGPDDQKNISKVGGIKEKQGMAEIKEKEGAWHPVRRQIADMMGKELTKPEIDKITFSVLKESGLIEKDKEIRVKMPKDGSVSYIVEFSNKQPVAIELIARDKEGKIFTQERLKVGRLPNKEMEYFYRQSKKVKKTNNSPADKPHGIKPDISQPQPPF